MMLDYIGFSFVLFLTFEFVTEATNVDIFSVFNDKEANQVNPHNIKQSRLTFPHESFELFPFFNELFPLRGLNEKSNDIRNHENVKDQKDVILDTPQLLETSPGQLRDKENKKNRKDKLIMSFTELFIPFQNQRSKSEFNNLKKNDIFEDIFNSFPFSGFDNLLTRKQDKQFFKKHRLPKKNSEKIIRTLNNSASNLKSIFENDGFDVTPEQPVIKHFEPGFVKFPSALTLFTKYNITEDQVACEDHQKCNKGHCSSKIYKSNDTNNESNLNKKFLMMDKTFPLYVIPGLIGFGALIYGIEVLRRHNELVKRTPFLSQYNQVQSC